MPVSRTTKRIVLKTLILTGGIVALIVAGGFLFDGLRRFQENRVRNADVDLKRYEKKIDDIRSDPKFQQTIRNQESLDEAVSILKEADDVLRSAPSNSNLPTSESPLPSESPTSNLSPPSQEPPASVNAEPTVP